MKILKQFVVPFSGLKNGKHELNYNLDSSFFAEYEYSLVKKGSFEIKLVLEKSELTLLMIFEIEGKIEAECERCLETFTLPVFITEKQIVKFVSEIPTNAIDDDEITYIKHTEYEYDISTLLYDYINSSLPLVVKHSVAEQQLCDNNVKQLLETTKKATTTPTSADERWNKLKDIF